MLRNISQSGVGYQSNLLDMLVMVSYKAKVRCHCSEILPAGKLRCINDQAGKSSRLFDIWINSLGESLKITFL